MWSQSGGLEVLHAVAAALQFQGRAEDLAQGIVEVLDAGGGHQRAALLMVEPEQRRLLPLAISRSGRDAATLAAEKQRLAEADLRLGRGITGWVAQTGETARVGDVQNDRRYVAIWPESRSELCVPLRFQQRVVGVVNVEARDADRYQDADQRLLEIVAAQSAATIELAYEHDRLGGALRRHNTQRELHHLLTAINMSSGIVLQHTDPQDPYFGEIHAIKRAAERAAELSRQLLAMRRS